MSYIDRQLDALIGKLDTVEGAARKAMSDAVNATAFNIYRDAIAEIRKPSIGKLYSKHRASKEGESPNTDTGRLVGSIRVDAKFMGLTAYVGTDLDYGAFLELLKNRPWLKPAMDNNESTFNELLLSSLKRAVALMETGE